jgi:hypothetical protein
MASLQGKCPECADQVDFCRRCGGRMIHPAILGDVRRTAERWADQLARDPRASTWPSLTATPKAVEIAKRKLHYSGHHSYHSVEEQDFIIALFLEVAAAQFERLRANSK